MHVLLAALVAVSGPLSGKMATMSYLVGGTWTCSTHMSAMAGEPANSGQSTVTFWVTPGNTVHDHVATPRYANDDYYGFDAKTGMYWQSSADNINGHAYSTSKDGVTFTGSAWEGPGAIHTVSTYKKLSANKVTVHEVMSGGGHSGTFDATCTR